jgi:hypothetical protein
VIYRAAASYPHDNEEQASAALRGQLRIIALAGGGIPDWSTLVLEGPFESTGFGRRSCYEWSATLSADGGRDLTRESIDDDLGVLRTSDPADSSTMPQSTIT